MKFKVDKLDQEQKMKLVMLKEKYGLIQLKGILESFAQKYDGKPWLSQLIEEVYEREEGRNK